MSDKHHSHSHDHSHSHSHGHSHDHMPHDFSQEHMIKRFENEERDTIHHFSDTLFPKLRELLEAVAPDAVGVDIGGGTGFVARKLASFPGLCKRVYSADSSRKMIEFAEKKLAEHPDLAEKVVPLVCGESELTTLPERVDFIVSVDVYHHLKNHAEYFRRLAKENCNGNAILLLIDYKPGKLMKDGEEYGPKESWNVKVSALDVAKTIADSWTLVHRVDLDYHYNLFFLKTQ